MMKVSHYKLLVYNFFAKIVIHLEDEEIGQICVNIYFHGYSYAWWLGRMFVIL